MARRIRLAGERAGRVAAAAVHDRRQILAALDAVVGARRRDGGQGEQRRGPRGGCKVFLHDHPPRDRS